MKNLPTGWITTNLDSVVDILDAQRVPVNKAERAKRHGSVPYYGATGQVGWINEPIFDEELLLVGEDGVPFLDHKKAKSYIIRGPSWVNNHAHVLRALTGITSNRYLMHYLNRFDYRDYVNGTTRLKLTQGSLRMIPVALPPSIEQERIVERIEEIFTHLEAIETTLESLLKRLSHVRSAILADAFHTNRQLPNGWRWAKLGQVCKKPQYGWTTKSTLTEGIPYLRITDISSGSIDWASVPSCVELPKDIEKFLLSDGDIVVSRAGFSVGVSHLLRDPPRSVFASYLIRLRANEDLIPDYLAFYLKSPAYWKAISENKIGVAIPNVNARRLVDTPIPVPSRLEQQDIIERIESEFSHLDTIEASTKIGLEQVATLRRSVLAEAFAGRLVAQDPDDEPASVLLERIAATRPAKPKRRRKARA